MVCGGLSFEFWTVFLSCPPKSLNVKCRPPKIAKYPVTLSLSDSLYDGRMFCKLYSLLLHQEKV